MITEIAAKNLRTLKDVQIKIPNVKTINFVGPKGSGKSSLFEALSLAYYGRGRTKNIQTMGQDENYSVSVEQTHKDAKWRINRADKKVGQTMLFSVNDTDYTSKKITEVQEKFDAMFGCSYDVFINTYFFQQGEADALFAGAGAARLELMRKIFNYDFFKKCLKDTKQWIDSSNNAVSEHNGALKILKDSLLTEKQIEEMTARAKQNSKIITESAELIAELHGKIAKLPDDEQYQDAKEQVDKLNSQIKSGQNKLKEMSFVKKDVEEKISNLKKENIVVVETTEAEIEKLGSKLEGLDDELSSTQSALNKKTRLKKENSEDIERLNEQSTICPTCERDGYDKHKEQIPILEKKNVELGKEITDLEQKLTLITQSHGEVKAYRISLKLAVKLTRALEFNEQIEKLLAAREKLTAIIDGFADTQKKKATYEDELEEAEEKKQAAHRSLTADEQAISQCEKAKKEILAKQKSLDEITETRRKYLILQEAFGNTGAPKDLFDVVLPMWENKANEIYAQLDHIHKVKITPSESSIDFFAESQFGDKEYKDLSGGEKAIFVFSIRLALTYILIDLFGMSYKTIFLDEMFGAIDSESRELVMKMIKMLAKDFDQIFIISHNEDSDIAEAVFRFKKNEDGFTTVEAA